MTAEKKKYFLIYLKTGGGHFAPARSIAKYINQNYCDSIEPVLIDGFERSGSLIKDVIEGGYRQLQAKAKWMYEVLYATHKFRPVAIISSSIISFFVVPGLKKRLLKEKPEKIVLFHFFLIKPVLQIVKKYKLPIKVLTLVTDPFTAHPVWFNNKDQDLIVFSEQMKSYCIKKGMDPKRIAVFPFILDDIYSKPLEEEEVISLKKKYGYDEKSQIILILGGGDGIPKGDLILRRLLKILPDKKIIMVCGKNKELYNIAERIKNKHDYKNITIYGYVDFIYELLNISDIVITKCGASTFMEILLTRKIPIIINYLWGQEKGNKDFVVKNDLGIYQRNLRKLPFVIKNVLENPELYNRYRRNILNSHLKNGAEQVSEYIINF